MIGTDENSVKYYDYYLALSPRVARVCFAGICIHARPRRSYFNPHIMPPHTAAATPLHNNTTHARQQRTQFTFVVLMHSCCLPYKDHFKHFHINLIVAILTLTTHSTTNQSHWLMESKTKHKYRKNVVTIVLLVK